MPAAAMGRWPALRCASLRYARSIHCCQALSFGLCLLLSSEWIEFRRTAGTAYSWPGSPVAPHNQRPLNSGGKIAKEQDGRLLRRRRRCRALVTQHSTAPPLVPALPAPALPRPPDADHPPNNPPVKMGMLPYTLAYADYSTVYNSLSFVMASMMVNSPACPGACPALALSLIHIPSPRDRG